MKEAGREEGERVEGGERERARVRAYVGMYRERELFKEFKEFSICAVIAS